MNWFWSRDEDANYVSAIQVLKPTDEEALTLPAIRPLKAEKTQTRVERFQTRLDAHRGKA